MHNRIPPIFKISALAAAVFTLSGCATSSLPLPSDLGSSIGNTIMDAGRVTANASLKALEGTKKIVGLDRLERSRDQELDEVDLALIDTQDTWEAEQPVTATGVAVRTAEMQPGGMPAIASVPAIDPNAVPVATVDYTHIVGQQETMWTIAKSTTGNANNWRILAEINQLNLNTPMQIGQEILIPADLVLPEIVASIEPSPLLENTAAVETTIAAANPTALEELPPLDLQDGTEVAIRPITQESLESDPLNLTADNDALAGDVDNELIIIEASAKAPVEAELESDFDPSVGAIALKADAGETLWDMAKRTTGDATNWKVIAENNRFTETDIGRIRYGQTIYIPSELVKAELGGEKVEDVDVAAVVAKPETAVDAKADAAATDNLVAASVDVDEAVNQEAVDATSQLVASASNLMDETQEIKIVEAKYQSDDVMNVMPSDDSSSDQIIMVSGTYYPKAVYNEADFSSSLLMRVSPGTEMMVSRAMGPWFEVQTENGVGYMHSRDIK